MPAHTAVSCAAVSNGIRAAGTLQGPLPLHFGEPNPDCPVNPGLKGELSDRSDHSG